MATDQATDPAKAGKTKVVLLQNSGGKVVAVRVGDVELPVFTAAPVVGSGGVNVVVTLADVEVSVAAVGG